MGRTTLMNRDLVSLNCVIIVTGFFEISSIYRHKSVCLHVLSRAIAASFFPSPLPSTSQPPFSYPAKSQPIALPSYPIPSLDPLD